MPRLLDHAKRQAEGLPDRLEDIQEQEVTITGVRWLTGNYGPYCVFSTVDSNGEMREIMTSAFLVTDALENADKEKAFPCKATFTRKGRTWTIA